MWVLVALAIVGGASPVVVALVVAAAWVPLAILPAATVWAVVSKRRATVRPDDEARYLQALTAALESGASLPLALEDAARSVPVVDAEVAVRRARSGEPLGRVGDRLAAALSVNGDVIAAVLDAAEEGGRLAPTMARLSDRATRQAALQRTRRVRSAQARFSAWVIAGIPLSLVVVLAATGRITLAGAAGLFTFVGGALMMAGVGAVVLMVRRAR